MNERSVVPVRGIVAAMVCLMALSCNRSTSSGDDPPGGGMGGDAEQTGGRAGDTGDQGGRGGDAEGGAGGSAEGGAGGSGGSGGTQGGAGGGTTDTGGRAGAGTGGNAGGMAGTGAGGGGMAGGNAAKAADGPGVMFSGLSTELTKVVPTDAEPGYMRLRNGITTKNVEDITIEPKEVSDPALPEGTKYVLWSRTENPGAVNLIWNINFRADKGNGGQRTDWQPLDVSGYQGFEFYAKSSFARPFNAVLYSGASGSKSSQTKNLINEWTRVRLSFSEDFFGGQFDPKTLGRIDLVMHVENNNPPIEWSITGLRLLTAEQFQQP